MSNAAQAISSLDQSINSFKSRIDVKVDNISISTSNIQATTDKIYQNVNKFKTEMMQGEEKQIAHENILKIDQIIKEQFSNHIAIRRTVMGVVRDFDINLVRNSTIQELSEELWITSSRYWLSYALLAVTAWVNDFPELAKNALAECGRKDAIKTTLFFCILNLRFNRIEVAKSWFYEYLRTLDPNTLQQETAVLLQAYLNGIFGKDKELEHQVIKLIDQWISIINENESASNELFDAYAKFIANLHITAEESYDFLPQFCSNFNEIAHAGCDVLKFKALMDFVKSIDVESLTQTDDNYKKRIDDIIFNLVSNYDAEELELKKQQDYYRCIIDNNGVIERAEAQFEAMEDTYGGFFNIGKQMIHWVLYDDDSQTDVQVRKFGFQNTKGWFVQSVEDFDDKLHDAYPLEYSLKIGKWESISNGEDMAEQTESLDNYLENNKFQNMFVNNYNITAAIVLIASIGLAFVSLFSLIATVGCIGFLVYRVIKAREQYPITIREAHANLNGCMNEISEFRRSFSENLNKKDELLGMVEFL